MSPLSEGTNNVTVKFMAHNKGGEKSHVIHKFYVIFVLNKMLIINSPMAISQLLGTTRPPSKCTPRECVGTAYVLSPLRAHIINTI